MKLSIIEVSDLICLFIDVLSRYMELGLPDEVALEFTFLIISFLDTDTRSISLNTETGRYGMSSRPNSLSGSNHGV